MPNCRSFDGHFFAVWRRTRLFPKIAVAAVAAISIVLGACQSATSTSTPATTGSNTAEPYQGIEPANLQAWGPWYVSGPIVQTMDELNQHIADTGWAQLTTFKEAAPAGTAREVEFSTMISDSGSYDGKPTRLPEESRYVTLTYRSTQPLVLQAREGNADGSGCVHGGSHPSATLPAAVKITTVQLPWSAFTLQGRPLDPQNVCKLNFVNYHPAKGAEFVLQHLSIDQWQRPPLSVSRP